MWKLLVLAAAANGVVADAPDRVKEALEAANMAYQTTEFQQTHSARMAEIKAASAAQSVATAKAEQVSKEVSEEQEHILEVAEEALARRKAQAATHVAPAVKRAEHALAVDQMLTELKDDEVVQQQEVHREELAVADKSKELQDGTLEEKRSQAEVNSTAGELHAAETVVTLKKDELLRAQSADASAQAALSKTKGEFDEASHKLQAAKAVAAKLLAERHQLVEAKAKEVELVAKEQAAKEQAMAERTRVKVLEEQSKAAEKAAVLKAEVEKRAEEMVAKTDRLMDKAPAPVVSHADAAHVAVQEAMREAAKKSTHLRKRTEAAVAAHMNDASVAARVRKLEEENSKLKAQNQALTRSYQVKSERERLRQRLHDKLVSADRQQRLSAAQMHSLRRVAAAPTPKMLK